MRITSLSCCAIREIASLASSGLPAKAMKEFCLNYIYYDQPLAARTIPTYFVFSEVVKYACAGVGKPSRPYGKQFADFIRKNKLGTITSPAQAPNRTGGGNTVKVYIWKTDAEAIAAWFNGLNKK